ncbi:MAG: hypothetical protein FJZ62_00370 [Chlamydiae bacterium]|nr:hypothetical protein [Chlamydiota bacterium]
MKLFDLFLSKFFKRLAISLSILLILLIGLPYLVPKILIEKIASSFVDGTVTLERASLSPFGKMRFEKIDIVSSKINGSIDEIGVDSGFYWMILFLETTNVTLKNPDLSIEKIPSTSKNKEKKEVYQRSLFNLIFENGTFRFNEAEFSNINGYCHLGKNFFYSRLDSNARYGQMSGSFSMESALRCDEKWSEALSHKQKLLFELEGFLDFNSKSFPLLWSKEASNLIGSFLNSKIQLRFDPSFVGTIEVDSPLIYLDAAINFDEETLSFTRPCTFNYVLSNDLVQFLNLPFSLEGNSSVGGAIKSGKEWSIQLKNPLKIRTLQESILGVETFKLDRNFKNVTLDSQLKQPAKGSLSLKTVKDVYQFQVNNFSTAWGELYQNGEILKELGPTLSLNGNLNNNVVSFLVTAQNLSLPTTKIRLDEKGFTLLEPILIHSALGHYEIQNFTKLKEDTSFSIKGGDSRFPLKMKGYETNLYLKKIELEKSLGSNVKGDFFFEFNELKGPYSAYLFQQGSLEGTIDGSLEKFKIENLKLKAPNGTLETAFEIEENFEKIFSIQPTHFSFTLPQQLGVKGVISSFEWEKKDKFEFYGHVDYLQSSLKEIPIEVEGGKGFVSFRQEKGVQKIEYKTHLNFEDHQKAEGTFASEGKVEFKNSEAEFIDIEVDSKNFPLEIISKNAVNFLGKSIHIQGKAKGRNLVQGEIKLENPLINAELFGTYSKEGFTLSKNLKKSTVVLSVHSLQHLNFFKDRSIRIKGGGHLKVDCQSLFFPLSQTQKKLEIVANLEAKNIQLINQKTGNDGEFVDTRVTIDKRSFGPFNVQIDTTTSYTQINAPPANGSSSFRCIYDPFQPNSLHLYLNFDHFPTLDIAFLGPKLDGTAFIDATQGNGKSALHLKSETFQMDLDAKVEKGVLFLTSPIKGRLRNIQIDDTTLQKGSWVPFYIPSRDVQIPLFPLKPQNIQVPKIVVSPFVLDTKVEGNTKSVLSSLNVGYKGNVLVYCVPVCGENQKQSFDQRPASASILNGVFYLPRLDLLVGNKIWLVVWGSVDLKTEATTLFLGISGLTLAQTLGIEQLSPDFVLPIRYSGVYHTIQIQKQDIVTAIAFLTAKIYSQRLAPKGGEVNLDFLVDQRGVPPLICPPSWYPN